MGFSAKLSDFYMFLLNGAEIFYWNREFALLELNSGFASYDGCNHCTLTSLITTEVLCGIVAWVLMELYFKLCAFGFCANKLRALLWCLGCFRLRFMIACTRVQPLHPRARHCVLKRNENSEWSRGIYLRSTVSMMISMSL